MVEERVQRRLAAILAADIVGYSRLIEADEAGTRTRIKALHSELINPRIADCGGRIVKTMGDGILVEFSSAVDAVRNALDIQGALRRRNADLPETTRIEFRVGINVGDVIVEGDDIHGDGVNVAARLEGLCEPGEIYVSGTVFDQASGKLSASFENLGEQTVKNIAKSIRVYQVRAQSGEGPNVTAPLPVPDKPSIAVLPFDNMSGDPDQEYFSDGITEDIITGLSRWPDIPVIARNSTFVYKGRAIDVKQVAKELGAAYVLEGSVRKSGNKVRIAAQLIDAETGHHLWAETFDRELEDVFELQDEISQQIAATVEPEVFRAEYKKFASKPPGNLGAWDYVHRGVYLFYNRRNPDDMEAVAQAREMFARAPEVDQTNSPAHSHLAMTYHIEIMYEKADSREDCIAKLEDHAQQAVSLDESNHFAHLTKGLGYRWRGQHDLAVAETRRAVELNPNDSLAIAFLGNFLDLSGKPKEGIPYLEKSVRLDPRSPNRHHRMAVLARAFLNNRDYQAAANWARKSVHWKADARSYLFLASSLGHLHELDEARSALEECDRLHPGFANQWTSRKEYRNDEDNEHIIAGLRKAGWDG